MEAPENDAELAMLRDQVLAAAQDTWGKRTGTGIGCSGPVLCFAFVAGPFLLGAPLDLPGVTPSGWLASVVAPGVVLLGGAVGLTEVVSIWVRASHRTGLRSRMANLRAARQAEVLLPLTAHPSRDVRALVRPLLREFGLPTEVTPTGAPGSRGDEPAPAAEQGG